MRPLEVLAWSLAFILAVIVYVAAAVMAWPIKWTDRGLAWLLRWSVGTMSLACAVFDGERLRPPEVWRGFDYGVGQGPPPMTPNERLFQMGLDNPPPSDTEMMCAIFRTAPRHGDKIVFRRYGK